MNRKLLLTAAASLLLAASAWATPIFDPEVRNCTTRNCRAIVLGGTVTGFHMSALPWVMQVYAGPRECLRVEVTSQETDMEMRIVSPDGNRSWLSDDSGLAPCPLCPLLAIRTGDRDGWYSVQVSEWGGNPVMANFTLAYGRYPRDNPNCTTFIPADDAGVASSVDKDSESPAPDPRYAPGR